MPPTVRQREAWETATRLGSQTAAAKVFGMAQGQFRHHLVLYAKAMGLTLDDLPGAATGRPREHLLYPLIDRILRRQEEIDASLSALDAKLDQLLARPVAIAAFQPSHRRQADGGQRVKRQGQARSA